MRSPSRSRWRPCTRWPLTNEPLREEPSSTSVHSSPMRSSTACTRDTDGSSGQRDVARLLAPDRRALELRAELEDPLLVLVRAVEQVGRAAAVRLEPLLQLGG